jgi:cytochrome c
VRLRVAAAASLLAALALPPRLVSGEDLAARGRAVFEARCASCHALEAGRDGLPGPHLTALLGRGVAGDPAFDYSPALEAARGRAAWDAATLDHFLADPEAMFPGLWMGENGVRDAADRAAVVRFLTGGG